MDEVNVSCASFYSFSCEFMPEKGTWATAGVEQLGGGSIVWHLVVSGRENKNLSAACVMFPRRSRETAQGPISVQGNAAGSAFLKSRVMIYGFMRSRFCKLKKCGLILFLFKQVFLMGQSDLWLTLTKCDKDKSPKF